MAPSTSGRLLLDAGGTGLGTVERKKLECYMVDLHRMVNAKLTQHRRNSRRKLSMLANCTLRDIIHAFALIHEHTLSQRTEFY